MSLPGSDRRAVIFGAGALAAAAMGSAAAAQVPANPRSAGPIVPSRNTVLAGKVAVVTGTARGIGRAIAVELCGERRRCGPDRYCRAG